MRRTGESTRLFHAIVVMGLGAAAAACGGQVGGDAGNAMPDAANEVVSAADASDDSRDAASFVRDAAILPLDSDADAANDAPSDAGIDWWIPHPPVIA